MYGYFSVVPLDFQEGDIFGVHISLNSFSQLYLQEQIEGGLLNLCIEFSVDSPAPLTILVTSDFTTKSYNNVPLETLLISEYH